MSEGLNEQLLFVIIVTLLLPCCISSQQSDMRLNACVGTGCGCTGGACRLSATGLPAWAIHYRVFLIAEAFRRDSYLANFSFLLKPKNWS